MSSWDFFKGNSDICALLYSGGVISEVCGWGVFSVREQSKLLYTRQRQIEKIVSDGTSSRAAFAMIVLVRFSLPRRQAGEPIPIFEFASGECIRVLLIFNIQY